MTMELFEYVIRAGRIVIPFFWQNTIYAGVIFLMFWALIKLFRIQSPRWQYALWLLILIRLALPPNLSHSLSTRNLLGQVPAFDRLVHWFDFFSRNQKMTAANPNDFLVGNGSEGDFILHSPASFPSFATSKYDLLFAGLFLVWFFGASIFLFIYLKKLYGFHSIVKQARPVTNPKILEIAQKWGAQLHIRRRVSIVCSEQYLSPFTSGILKPIIYVPQKAIKTHSENLLKPVIAHEMAHIKRWENVWMKLLSLLQIVYFFNPIVWLVNSRLSLSRECICDNMVLARKKISFSHYGSGIMAILKLNLFSAEEINVLPGFGSQQKN